MRKKVTIKAKAEQAKQRADGTHNTPKEQPNTAISNYQGSLDSHPSAACGIKASEVLVASSFPCNDCKPNCPYKTPDGICNLELERYKMYEKNFSKATMRDVMMHNNYRMLAMSDFIFEQARNDKYKKMYQPLVNLQRTISDQMKDMRSYEENKQITVEYKVTKELDSIRDLTGETVLTAEFTEIDEGKDIVAGKIPDESPLKINLTKEDLESRVED